MNTVSTENRQGPLAGIKVIDLSRVLAGPYCTAMMADLGAEVIKIEVPDHGDDSRHLGPFIEGESVYYGLINRGKRSIELDLKSESDLAILIQLVKESDVVVENFRPGVTKRLSIDFDSLKLHNPTLIYASISGFGQNSPLASYPAYDIVAQAMSGLMSVTGFPETGPTRSGESIGDVCAGMYASWAISSALFARERHAQSAQYIDVAMVDVLLSMQLTGLSNLFANNKAPSLVGNRHPVSTPFDTYQAKDGLVVIAIASEKLFQRFCECMGKPLLSQDSRYIDDPTRTVNQAELRKEIENWTKEQTVEEVCDLLLNAGVPASPIHDLQQATQSEHAHVRQVLTHLNDGGTPLISQPVFFNGVKPHSTQRAPSLGEANSIYKPAKTTTKSAETIQ
ncbi:CaiB/BaiF CoA transferase family protein [Providencia heimbachae]|uniref:Formyl-coenzyme A transferase n=1 Tax=Providencia heimbachae ATCC 35613 TaxID=1354272 RepID=A0A1B7JY29_9GAMM|nr:CoA transferase [Providencia heimbachae]OAT52786.1 formyl-coenzyme A transferase [Providencia heimbachae ATCC 35613]SQH14697.1 Formyl-coenzyme A transferase [Providencia heimbachae]